MNQAEKKIAWGVFFILGGIISAVVFMQSPWGLRSLVALALIGLALLAFGIVQYQTKNYTLAEIAARLEGRPLPSEIKFQSALARIIFKAEALVWVLPGGAFIVGAILLLNLPPQNVAQAKPWWEASMMMLVGAVFIARALMKASPLLKLGAAQKDFDLVVNADGIEISPALLGPRDVARLIEQSMSTLKISWSAISNVELVPAQGRRGISYFAIWETGREFPTALLSGPMKSIQPEFAALALKYKNK